MTKSLTYLNGRFLPSGEAALSFHDAGFVYGATVVDNARTFRQRLFRWTDHLARFRRDCCACCVPLDATDPEITAAAEELVAHNAKLLPPGGELQLATFATPGPLGLQSGQAANGPPTLGMTTYPLPFDRYRRFFTEGVTLVTIGHQPADATAILPPRIKHRSRMAWWKAGQITSGSPYPPGAIALFTDSLCGTITETAIANFACVLGTELCVPPSNMVLDGISLRVTAELNEVPMREQMLPLSCLPEMAEAMLMGTGFCIAGVRAVNGRTLPWPGPVFRRLLAAWSDHVGVDIARQFTE